jgi:hypothetical protein
MRKLKLLAATLALVLIAALLIGYWGLRGSLPRLDGEVPEAGLAARVSISRDARGVPTIEATNRADLAFATGFLHAQDRFFEMDLSRRLAAGELSELFGTVALDQDRKARLFRFRHVAGAVIEQASPEQRALMDAYTRGVNAGLAALVRPGSTGCSARSLPVALRTGSWCTRCADLLTSGLRRSIVRQKINAPWVAQVRGRVAVRPAFLLPRGHKLGCPRWSRTGGCQR